MRELETGKSEQENQRYFDTFVNILCEILENKRFLCFYEEKHQLSEQIELMMQIAGDRM